MKIVVDDIPEGGLSLDLSIEGDKIKGEDAGGFDFDFIGPVKAHLDLSKAKSDVSVTGEINARVKLECSRCLKEFEYPLDINFYDYFVRGSAEDQAEELRPEDLEVNFLEGPELDTTDIVIAQLALEAPMKPLCSTECKGLCPVCGADLNKGPCGHEETDKTDPRLTVLKGFKPGGQGRGPKDA